MVGGGTILGIDHHFLDIICIFKRENNLSIKALEKMKKLIFLFVALAAMSFASCGTAEKGAATDSVSDTVDTVVVDSVAADSVVA